MIQVIHQPNGGLSAARNSGLKAAKGAYVLFVDSDDYIDPQTCEKLYAVARQQNCEVVRGNCWEVCGTRKTALRACPVCTNPVPGVEFLAGALRRGGLSMCACFSLYQTDFLRANNLYFCPGLLHEDEFWTPQVYLKAQRVCSVPDYFYYYWQRENSITTAHWSQKRKDDLLFVCEQLHPLYQQQLPQYRKYLLDYLCMLYLHAINQSQDKEANRLFPLQTAYSLKNRLKAGLFLVSPRLYFRINRVCARQAGKTK